MSAVTLPKASSKPHRSTWGAWNRIPDRLQSMAHTNLYLPRTDLDAAEEPGDRMESQGLAGPPCAHRTPSGKLKRHHPVPPRTNRSLGGCRVAREPSVEGRGLRSSRRGFITFDQFQVLLVVTVVVVVCGGCLTAGVTDAIRDGKAVELVELLVGLVALVSGARLYRRAEERFQEGERGYRIAVMYVVSVAIPWAVVTVLVVVDQRLHPPRASEEDQADCFVGGDDTHPPCR